MNYNKNYYKILEIDKNSSFDEIKKNYRRLSKLYHPDINKNINDDKFKDISEAYSILSDTNTKQEYDQRSPHGNSYSSHNQFGGFEFNFGGGMDDILRQFFGGRNPFSGFQREEFRENLDINLSVTINLKQIYLDENLEVKYNKFIHCEDCKGTGFDKNSHSDTCEMCNGTGNNNGSICEYCQGDGKIYIGQCKKCKGEKVMMKETNITLQNISQLRNNIRNGHTGYGHQSKYYRDKIGNLILNINILRDDDYQIVNNYELSKNIDIHFQDAINGNEILFTHIDGSLIKIKLPEKSKNNDIIRIKEKGLLKNDNIRSDLYLKINIIIDYDRI